MSKKVLVTGAAGFIGSHLAERLVRDGHSVKALVRYNSADAGDGSIRYRKRLPLRLSFSTAISEIRL